MFDVMRSVPVSYDRDSTKPINAETSDVDFALWERELDIDVEAVVAEESVLALV